jgi:hypothetical protein
MNAAFKITNIKNSMKIKVDLSAKKVVNCKKNKK